MKKLNSLRKIILISVGIMVVLPLFSYFIWLSEGNKSMEVYIVNKTVTQLKNAEHSSLMWTLNHLKYKKKDGGRYSLKNDYYGFIPKRGNEQKHYDLKMISLEDIDSISNTIDLAYFADTYGVFSTEWYETRYGNASTLIYGGLNLTDFLLLKTLHERKVPVIAEFNFIDYPTSPLNNYKVTNLFNLDYTGWKGKYFASLDTSDNNTLPKWMVHLYQKTHAGAWPFSKSGIVLVLEGKSIIVLENDTHLNSEFPLIKTDSVYAVKYKLPDELLYKKWFHVINPDDSATLMATLTFDVNELGYNELIRQKLSPEIPLVFKTDSVGTFHYFAGDFSNNSISYSTYRFEGIDGIEKYVSSNRRGSNAFFWKYYLPLMKGILSDIAKSQGS